AIATASARAILPHAIIAWASRLPEPCRRTRVCAWSFDDGDGPPRQVSGPCDEEVKARLVSNRPTIASVDIILMDGTALRLVSDIVVRDALIAGMGDSIAAGGGKPAPAAGPAAPRRRCN